MPPRRGVLQLTMPSWVHRSLRSEEHTSELQSQSNLVCRLLLEKKKQTSKLQSQSNIVCRILLEKKNTVPANGEKTQLCNPLTLPHQPPHANISSVSTVTQLPTS